MKCNDKLHSWDFIFQKRRWIVYFGLISKFLDSKGLEFDSNWFTYICMSNTIIPPILNCCRRWLFKFSEFTCLVFQTSQLQHNIDYPIISWKISSSLENFLNLGGLMICQYHSLGLIYSFICFRFSSRRTRHPFKDRTMEHCWRWILHCCGDWTLLCYEWSCYLRNVQLVMLASTTLDSRAW
jgi:hypothetical protein